MRRIILAVLSAPLLLGSTVFLQRWLEIRELRRLTSTAALAEAMLPHRVLWAWERPEDLHHLQPVVAVAVLDGTVHLHGDRVDEVPRRQPVLLTPGDTRIAVVRIESDRGLTSLSRGTSERRRADMQLKDILLRAAHRPGIAALQVDWDARRSERPRYRFLLENLRREMPKGMPLEMTALVSWCGGDDWIRDLPINAAIPMFFRMEPDAPRLVVSARRTMRVKEPLCQSSVGVSTHEPWPIGFEAKRLYVFADDGWAKDLPLLEANGMPELSSSLERHASILERRP